MEKGIFITASGGRGQERAMDVIANNLANINTAGFKRDRLVFETYLQKNLDPKNDLPTIAEIGQGNLSGRVHDSAYMIASQSYTDFSQGHLKFTQDLFDVALSGDGFFSVATPDGEFFTRGGSFSIGKDGELVTMSGYPLLGENGAPIYVGEKAFNINATGQVFDKDNNFISKLRVVDFEDKSALTKRGEHLFIAHDRAYMIDSNAEVKQGFVESSNVEPMAEISGMITAVRAYEAFQKSIQSHDEMTSRLIADVGRP